MLVATSVSLAHHLVTQMPHVHAVTVGQTATQLTRTGLGVPTPTPPPPPFTVPVIPAKLLATINRQGKLESPWVAAGFGLAAVVAAFFGVFRPLRRGAWRQGRRRQWVVMGSTAGSILLLLTAVAAGVNTYVGYFRTVSSLVNFVTNHNAATTGLDAAGPAGGAPTTRATPGAHPGQGSAATASAAAPSPTSIAPGDPAHPRRGAPQEPTQPSIHETLAPNVTAPLTHSELRLIPIQAPEYGLPEAPAYVYLPVGYQSTGKPWPILLLVGAAPGAADDWVSTGNANGIMDRLVSGRVAKPFVIVMPTTNPSYLQDNECLDTLAGPQVESYLIEKVMPTLSQQLNISADRHDHAIAGFSAGADCALNIGLHHLDMFSVLGSMDAEGFPGTKADHRLLGDRADLIRANSPFDYLPTMTLTQPAVVYLNAAGSYNTQRNNDLQHEFEARGIYVYRHDEPQLGHNWRDPRQDLPFMLDFISAAFSAPATSLSPPLPPAPSPTASS